MENIVIVGAGGFGREVSSWIESINEIKPTFKITGYYDDNISLEGTKILNRYPYLGTLVELDNTGEKINAVIAIGNPKAVWQVKNKLNNPNLIFPTIIHPSTITYGDSYKVGEGNLIGPYSIISCDVKIGNFNIFNTYVSVGHDTVIESYNVMNPRVLISGNCKIGNRNLFGLNSAMIQGKTLGDENTLGPGSILYASKKNNSLLIGNPAKNLIL